MWILITNIPHCETIHGDNLSFLNDNFLYKYCTLCIRYGEDTHYNIHVIM